MVDPNGVATRYEYDALDRLVAVVENHLPGIDPGPGTNVRTEYSYDALGNRLTIQDANGNLTSFSYDVLGRLLSETDPLGNATRQAYDAAGNRVAQTDAAGFVTTYRYDAAGRLVTIDLPEPDVDVQFTYDAAGNRVEMVDGLGTTSWAYDSLYRPTTITDPFGSEVGYGYDAAGNRTLLTYPDARLAAYEYDPAGRLVQVTDWASYLTTYDYDDAGRLASVTLPNGVVSSYSYDAAGQLTALAHNNGGGVLSSFEYTYDPAGNRTRLVESMLYPWTPETATAGSQPVAAPSAMPSDPVVLLFAPLALAAAFALRRRTWHSRLIVFLFLLVGFGAFAAGCTWWEPRPPDPTPTPSPTLIPPTATSTATEIPPTSTSTSTEIPPTATNTPTEIPPTATNTPTEIPPTATPTPTPTPEPVLRSTTIDYGYDPLGRLISADYTHAGAGSPGEFFHYTYDSVGNRLTQNTQAGSSTYAYDAANRLIELDGAVFDWDVNGNLLRDHTGAAYTYDHQNRLFSVEMGGTTYAFAYNGLGDRVQQRVDGVTSTYTLDLNTGLTQVLSDGTYAYLYGLGRIGEEQFSGWAYHLPDALGSVRQLANGAGVAILAKAYEPFGSPLSAGGLATTSYGFTGEWTDATGLVHLRARYYQPEVGRFFQPDPFSGLSYLPRTLHPYVYAFNNPLRYSDPTGQIPIIPVVIAFALLGGAINYAGQVFNNIQSGRKGADALFNCINLWDVVTSAASAAVTTAVFLTMAAAFPIVAATPILSRIGIGFLAGGLSSLAGQLTSNFLTPGVPMHHQLLPALAMGSIAGGLGYGFHSVLGPLARNTLGAFARGFLTGFGSLGAGQLAYNILTPDREWHEDVAVAAFLAGFIGGTVETVRYARAQATGQVRKGPNPDEQPRNLREQLALEEAMASGGEPRIFELGDRPRLEAIYGPGNWVKMHYIHRGLDGRDIVIHWFENLTTGVREEIKFITRWPK
jgi:RHS repeat-associated protein